MKVMDRIVFYQKLGFLPEDMEQLAISRQRLLLQEVNGYIDDMTQAETAERSYQGLREQLEKYMKKQQLAGISAAQAKYESCYDMLYCQLESARHVYEKYQVMGIGEKIFFDTMKCFPRFMDECQAQKGIRYFDRGWWTYRQTSMRLFRIGVLEYEMAEANREEVSGSEVRYGHETGQRRYSTTVRLHIPSDADLSPAAVDASIQEAVLFFRKYYPRYGHAEYTCHSWLLAPALKRLLREDSRILAFQRRFDIGEVDEGSCSYLQWIFQASEDVPLIDLPEQTSLQRTAKNYLLAGGRIGDAYGIMRIASGINNAVD